MRRVFSGRIRSTFAVIALVFARETVAQERVEIVLSNTRGAATQRGSGFLGSLSQNRPSDELVKAVKPGLFRLDESMGKKVYNRVTALGATAQLVPSYPIYKGPNRNTKYETWITTWEGHLRELVDETHRRNESWQWDIWNEPNWPKFWTGTREQFFETWRRSYRIIRAKLPRAVIVGPSIAFYDSAYLQAFLRYAKSHDVLPDVLSWHELTPQSPAAIPGRVAEMRTFLSTNAIPISRIQLNEITPASHQFRPGSLIWFFAAVERAGVEAAAKSCWFDGFQHNCINDSLNGLLSGDQPRSAYWAYKAYADVVGQLVEVVPSPNFDGVAGRDSNTVRAIIGNHDSKRRSLTVRVSGLDRVAGLGDLENVRVRVERISNSERKPLSAPIQVLDKAVPIVAGGIELDLSELEGWAAVVLEIAAH